MADTSSAKPGYVIMFTAGEWTLGDVAIFVHTFDQLYGTFLTVYMANERVQKRAGAGWSHPTLSDYVLQPLLREPPDAEGWAPQPMQQPTRALPIDLPFGPEIRYLQFLFEHRYTFVPEAQPGVYSWRMESPGRISISGVGHIIQQVREFWKDMSFRNRQERTLGDLEIARKYIELQETVLSGSAVDYMAAQLLTDYKPLKLLQDQNKILLPSSFRANFEGFIHRLENLAKEVPELKPVLRRAAGLSDPKTKSWEQRLDRVQKDILQLYQADKLEEGTYNGLRNRLRDLVKAQSEGE